MMHVNAARRTLTSCRSGWTSDPLRCGITAIHASVHLPRLVRRTSFAVSDAGLQPPVVPGIPAWTRSHSYHNGQRITTRGLERSYCTTVFLLEHLRNAFSSVPSAESVASCPGHCAAGRFRGRQQSRAHGGDGRRHACRGRRTGVTRDDSPSSPLDHEHLAEDIASNPDLYDLAANQDKNKELEVETPRD